MIPDYINCNNKEILVCDYFLLKDCPNTCAYSKDVTGIVREFREGELIERVENNGREN